MSRHKQLQPHQCLIQSLVDDFVQRPPREVRQTLVLLPTRRLQLHLAAHLAYQNGGAAWLPKMKTWDQFVSDSTLPFLNTDMVMVSQVAELVLAQLLRLQPSPHVNDRHAHELLHFLRELWRHGVRHTAQSDILNWLRQQWHLDEKAFQELSARFQALFECLDGFEANLQSHNRVLRERQQFAALSDLLIQVQDQSWIPPNARVIIAGLTTLPKVQWQLFQALVRYDSVEAWLSGPWDGMHPESPLHHLGSALGLAKPANFSAPKLRVSCMHSCIDPLHEAAAAWNLAESAFLRGIPPHRIAILVPDEKIYASALAHIAELGGQNCNIPLARSGHAYRTGQWLKLLKSWTTTHESVAFVRLLTDPCTISMYRLETSSILAIESLQTRLNEWLRHAPQFLHSADDPILERLCKELSRPETAYIKWCWDCYSGPKTQTFAEYAMFWQQRFVPMFEHFQEHCDSPLEASSWRSLLNTSQLIGNIPHGIFDQKPHWSFFVDAVWSLFLTSSSRDVGEPLDGIQIVSITEARYVPCDIAIIVGCVEGLFPHKPPRDFLVDDALKRAAHLPGAQQLEALEDTTFALLTARVPEVILTWPRSMGQETTVRSRWIESLHAEGVPTLERNADDLFRWLSRAPSKSINLDASADLEGRVNSSTLTPLMQSVSAQTLKSLMTCPYQFLLKKRGINAFEVHQDDDPRTIGALLHKVVELCCIPDQSAQCTLDRNARWREHFSDSADLEGWAYDRLRAITDQVVPPAMLATARILEITHRGWRALAQQWSQEFSYGWNPAKAVVELPFGRSQMPVTLHVNGRPIAVTGVIDMHQKQNGHWKITDFKLGAPPSGQDVRSGLEPQLILYTMCIEALDPSCSAQKGAISYWSLQQGKITTIAIGSAQARDHAPKQQGSSSKEALEDLVVSFVTKWARRMAKVEETQRFFASPNECRYCDYNGICRKDDPRYHERITQQAEERS